MLEFSEAFLLNSTIFNFVGNVEIVEKGVLFYQLKLVEFVLA